MSAHPAGESSPTDATFRASELSYRRWFEAAPDGILILDVTTGRVEDANPSLVNLLGFTREEMIGKTVGELSPFRDAPSNQAMLERLQKEGYVRYAHLPLQAKDGQPIAVEFVSTVYPSSDKSVIQCSIRDITEAKKTEAQLLWKNAFFAAQVNSALDGILVVDDQGRKILQNQRMADLWGIPPELAEEVDDRRQLEWASSRVKNPTQFKERIAYLHAHRDEIGHDELEFIDGKILDRHSAPVRDDHGTYYGRIWTFRDITERKMAEARLRESEERFRNMFTAAATGIAISTPQGRFLHTNGAYCRMLGYTEDELRSLTFAALTHPEDLEQNLKLRDEILSGQREHFTMEKRYLKKNGDIVWTLHSVSSSHAAGGEISSLTVVAEDITEWKRSEERFRLLVDSNIQGVLFWNRNGGITGANDAYLKLVGCTREDLEAGRINWAELTPPEHAHLDARALAEIDARGACAPYEKDYVLKDGSRVSILLGSAAFKDNPNEGVAFVLDLTERKKLERQFLRAQRMESIGTLAGGIAHDLNNILSPILMSIELLKEISENPEARSILATIEQTTQRGADIVRQLLFFARGAEGERIEVQPRHLLKDLETLIRDTFPKNIHLELGLAEDSWTVLGDSTQLHQILLNLCVNARDAMPEGGSLKITVENALLDEHDAGMHFEAKAGKYVRINVTDTGTGIPAEILDKVFEPFFTTKEVGKGTGIGLSTVSAIVKSHGGFVNVYSEPDMGTTFKVYLPAIEASADGPKEPAPSPRLPRGKGETILLVDDEPSILIITSRTLQAFGYRTLTAKNGAEAVAIYAQHRDKISAILTDMAMPIMDGTALIRALKSMHPGVKIVAASGLNTAGPMSRASGGGVRFFLNKPYTAEALLTAIRSLLDEA